MVKTLSRNIQATNMFFSFWAIVLLVFGAVEENWVELKFETKNITKSHSPWIHTAIWSEDDQEGIWIMMISVLSLSSFHNLFLGLEFSYMIPQTKCILFAAFFSFFTAILHLSALLLYHLKLRQGQSIYNYSYKITWIISTAYLNVFLLFTSGILSLLEYKQSTNNCACLTMHHNYPRESEDILQSEKSVEVISSPDCTVIPRSILRAHSVHPDRDFPEIQKRRITWAL